jgi:histidyl-tRNA synthetase
MSVQAARGTRDLLPAVLHRRLAVIQAIRETFAAYGFEPLETPAMERIDTLMGKYGDEGDKLIFRILERGEGGREGKADLALRYDLTVPLARVMAMNQSLPLPFKRYQIQPVWRADKPQRGRFREFYQCDCDIVGAPGRAADAECLALASDALTRLGFADYVIHTNHRALLRALVGACGLAERESEVLVAVDKLDKIGVAGVTAELEGRGIEAGAIDTLWRLLERPADLDVVAEAIGADAQAPAEELRETFRLATALGARNVVFDATLARGLSYYTGPVYEVKLTEGNVGSVAAGGRYDGLIGMFSGKQVPAVGVSLGLERLHVILEERGRLGDTRTRTRAMLTVFSAETQGPTFALAASLRAAGVEVETWLGSPGSLGKQFKYAADRGVPYALVLGPDELARGVAAVKDLRSGVQEHVPTADIATRIGPRGEA